MKLVPLREVFTVNYGVDLELNRMILDPTGIPFVSCSDRNNGSPERVRRLDDTLPNPAGTLSVAANGSVLATFLQSESYYSGRDVFYLQAKAEMTDSQKLFYSVCIRANRYKYGYGRKANRTLKDLLLPSMDDIPAWAADFNIDVFQGADAAARDDGGRSEMDLHSSEWKRFRLEHLFDLQKGKRLTKANMAKGDTPYIGATEYNNGVTNHIDQDAIFPGGCLSVSYDGSIAEAFYQPDPFWASDAVNVLTPRFTMSPSIAIFLCAVIRKEKYRFSYGRKWHLERMRSSEIHLPVDEFGTPDWQLMEAYVQSLSFSCQLHVSAKSGESA